MAVMERLRFPLFLALLALPFSGQACPQVVEEVRPVPAPAADEFTLATFNLWDLMEDSRDDSDLTAEDHDARIPVLAEWIREVLHAPHLLAVQEVETLARLEELAREIAARGGPEYRAWLKPGHDDSGINVGLLARAPVEVEAVRQILTGHQWTGDPLHDRPPLKARISAPLEMTLVVVHMRSGHGLRDEDRVEWVDGKRRAQARTLRAWLEDYKARGGTPVVAGDLNSARDAGLFSKPLKKLDVAPWHTAWRHVPDEDERFSYIFRCQRQAIDHVLIPASLAERVTRAAASRGNAGRYRVLYGARGTGEAVSDHDALVVYFELDSGRE